MRRQRAGNQDLHGNVPDESPVALILIDFINDLSFDGGEQLLEPALAAARRAAELKRRAEELSIACIYANDNFGKWRSDFRRLVDHCLADAVTGRPLAELLRPGPRDYFVLKPKHSGFFSTTLDTLLQYLKAQTLILAGLTADNCVLFTANDAYMRDFKLYIPSDCVASIDPQENRHALDHMQRVLKADCTASTELDLKEMLGSGYKLRMERTQSAIQSAIRNCPNP